jgi:hypothetical protein
VALFSTKLAKNYQTLVTVIAAPAKSTAAQPLGPMPECLATLWLFKTTKAG